MDVKTHLITEQVLSQLEFLERAGGLRFRGADVDECLASGLLPMAAVKNSVENSVEAYVVMIEGRVAAVWGFGVSSPLGECCYPWILTTDLIEHHKRRYVRGSARVVDYLLSRFPRLQIMVDCRYLNAISWLEWLGFDAHYSAVRIGPKGLPFLVMTMHREPTREMQPWDR